MNKHFFLQANRQTSGDHTYCGTNQSTSTQLLADKKHKSNADHTNQTQITTIPQNNKTHQRERAKQGMSITGNVPIWERGRL